MKTQQTLRWTGSKNSQKTKFGGYELRVFQGLEGDNFSWQILLKKLHAKWQLAINANAITIDQAKEDAEMEYKELISQSI